MTDQVNEAVAWLYTYPHDGESDHCLSASRLLPSWVAAKGATEQPLYTHPSRGVVDDAMVDMAMDADALEYGASIPASRVRRILQAAALPAVPEDAQVRRWANIARNGTPSDFGLEFDAIRKWFAATPAHDQPEGSDNG